MVSRKQLALAVAGALSFGTTGSCGAADTNSSEIASYPEREAFYGELHLHTNYSFDAYLFFGQAVGPDDAYRFAKGEPVKILGKTVRRSTAPLDFAAVTDHSEYVGMFNTIDDPENALSRSAIGKFFHEHGVKKYGELVRLMFDTPDARPDEKDVKATAASVWEREVEAANRHYEPGRFTTFVAYEWSSMPGGRNLHRNVIFRGNDAPTPFTALDSVKPEDLWAFLENLRKQGFEALAIPHNSNASGGLMFDWVDSEGRPIDQAYAERRAANEPLIEITQTKGQSEIHPALAPNDEFANFEIWETPQLHGNYVREGLGRGMVIAQRAGGVNPFKYGFVGGSDYHNGLSDSGENAYAGTTGASVPGTKLADLAALTDRYAEAGIALPMYATGSAGLTGVWAEQNTRESIFDALKRKETFATSGTRLKLRFFGGWDYDARLLEDPHWVKTAYARGVPMGGDLPANTARKRAPTFLLWAVKDPDGANLDRLQVVKIWLENGEHRERIFDVALSGARTVDPKTGRVTSVGNTVDPKRGTYENTIGAVELSSVWTDPEFDADVPAVYYLRVLEIPTPRWSTILAAERGVAPPDKASATIQERGWSSPIWYTPERR